MALSVPEFLILCGSLFLIGFLILEVINWGKIISSLGSNHELEVAVVENSDCEDERESLSRKHSENFESPVNIIPRQAVVIEVSEPLKWCGHSVPPIAMTMSNSGDTVTIQAFWTRGLVPSIFGGPLKRTYQLHSISFRWGVSDQSGSEHCIDQVKYPFEMQLLHVKETNPQAIVDENSEDIDATIVSYLFQIKDNDNPLLDPIIMNLCRIQEANAKVYIPPFQLDTVFPLFERKFYSYSDKLNQPFGEIATWIIYPEPLPLSAAQMEELRKISTATSRPMKSFDEQDLYYHE
ncbi:carbonic anhydrase 1 [Fopius arisanus]|uniref:Carbonic anhydrase 1 n=1 Tax=Fopius arisanus TaxID=64838 RepID=A0A9R1U0I8_9HYME|nr:PREDICTED: carbonic anhydrase 1-like [Fopius arisanus]